MTNTTPAVYEAINRVQAALSKSGIAKDKKNQQQGFKFRGIDDVYKALAPLLAKENLCILPRMLSRVVVERETSTKKVIFSVVVEAEFDFVATADGSTHTIKTFGEAMDMADKGTNKAMSAAYKYACFLAFCIPTEGDEDADASSPPEIAAAEPITLEFLTDKIIKAKAMSHLSNIWKKYENDIKVLPESDIEMLKNTKDKKKDELTAAAAAKGGDK